MKIYMAGSSTTEVLTTLVQDKIHPMRNRLISYLYQDHMRQALRLIRDRVDTIIGRNIIVDSGAFSAWNRGFEVDIKKYADFLKRFIEENHRHYENIYCVNLDVIPGGKSRAPTQQEVEDAPKRGFDNYLWLKGQGLPTIHVYHEGEDLKWLDTIKDACDYIGVSPSNDSSTDKRARWCDDAFHIIDPKKTKTHGFAVTSDYLMRRYPWTSVDSASWILVGAYGSVFTPWGLVYFGVKKDTGVRYNFMHEREQKQIQDWLAKYNLTVQQLFSKQTFRAQANYHYFKEVEESINSRGEAPKFEREQGLLFEVNRFSEESL